MSFIKIAPTRRAAPAPLSSSEQAERQTAQAAEVERQVTEKLAELHAQTLAKAKKAGEAEARTVLSAQTAQLTQTMASLNQAIAQLATPLAEKEQELAELVLDMAFQLACHIAGGQSGHAREDLFTLVSGLLNEAKAERRAGQKLRLSLHPSDLETIRAHALACEAETQEDASITPGGAVLELLGQSQDSLDKTVWDARLENRLAAARTALALPDKEDE